LTTLTPTPCKPARNFVAVAAEFAAGVQNCEHYFERALAFVWTGRIRVDGNASPVVLHFTRAVFVDGDDDLGAKPRHRLVDRVVDDLPNQVVEAAQTG